MNVQYYGIELQDEAVGWYVQRIIIMHWLFMIIRLRRIGGLFHGIEGSIVRPSRATGDSELGGSSKYSSVI